MKEMTRTDSGKQCPKCDARRLHRSRALDFRERAVRIIGGRKLRCHECGYTFFQMGSSVLAMKDIERAARKVRAYIVAALAVAVCLYVIRWIVLRTAEPSSPESFVIHQESPAKAETPVIPA